jgi:DNA-binding response OmpR family regulator
MLLRVEPAKQETTHLDEIHGRVLIIEDNTDIALLLDDFFTERGHITDYAHDGLTGLHLAASNEHDVIILDLALPGLDGIELCKQLRSVKRTDVPILMLTARDTLDDKLAGFEAGADDYLVKPFDLLEVYARVQALWRRSKHSIATTLQIADLSLNPDTRQIKRGKTTIHLNPVPYKILNLLMENSHRVVSRREIENCIWGDEPTDSDALRTHISALRNAIDKPFDKKLLHTMHGIGYRLYDREAEQA